MKLAILCRDAHGRRTTARLSCARVVRRAGSITIEGLDPEAAAIVAAGAYRGIRYLGGRSAMIDPRYPVNMERSGPDTG